MAIPEFQQQRLRSQLVGTAGIDTSTADVLGSAASASAKIHKAQKKQDIVDAKLQAKQDSILKESVVNTKSAVGQTQFNSGLIDLERKFRGDRDGFTKAAGELLTRTAGDIEDPDVRAAFTKAGGTHLVRYQQKVADRFRKENVDQVGENTNELTQEAARSAGEVFKTGAPLDSKLGMLGDILDLLDETLDPLEKVFGVKESARHKEEAQRDAIKSALDGLMDSAPEDVPDFLDKLGERLSPEEVQDARDDAIELSKVKKAEAEVAHLRITKKTTDDLLKTITSGGKVSQLDLTKGILNGTITSTMAKAIKDLQKSPDEDVTKDDPEANGRLLREYGLIARTNSRGKVKIKATFEQLASFQEEVLQQMAAKNITRTTGSNWIAQTSAKFNEGIDEIFDRANEVAIVIDWGIDGVENVLTDKGEIDAAKIRLQNEMFAAINKAETELGRRLKSTELAETIHIVDEQFKARVNPDRSKYKINKLYLNENGVYWRAVGYDVNGNALFEDDLSKPLQEIPKPK